MSADLARMLLDSDLPDHLARLAARLALYGTVDGERIFPSIGRLAHYAGRDRRTIQRQLNKLEELGVLIPKHGRTGGRGQVTHWKINLGAIPHRSLYDPDQPKGRHSYAAVSNEKGGMGVTLSDAKRAASDTPKGGICDQKGGICDQKGGICDEKGGTAMPPDQSIDQSVDQSVQINQDHARARGAPRDTSQAFTQKPNEPDEAETTPPAETDEAGNLRGRLSLVADHAQIVREIRSGRIGPRPRRQVATGTNG